MKSVITWKQERLSGIKKKCLTFSIVSCIIFFAASIAAYRGVEQLAARRAHNPEVVGSNPTPATIWLNSSVG